MMRIPFDPSRSADQSFSVLIPEHQVVELRMVWNTRASGWDVLVSGPSGSVGFLRLKPRWPLLLEHLAISPIDGDIIALPLQGGSGKGLDDFDALGSSWGLFWLSQDDVKAWRSANGLG
jgi:hypothetical protein